MNTQQLILTGIGILLGPGVATVIVQRLFRKYDQRQNDHLEQAIAASPTIRRLELEIQRQALFQPTLSRIQHEHQLDAGRAYTRLVGNGPGHVRYEQLFDDYRRRLETDDWTYRIP